jgi:hypothetical protein
MMFVLDEISNDNGQFMQLEYFGVQPSGQNIGFRLCDAIIGYLQSGAVSFKFETLRTTNYMLAINHSKNTAVILCGTHILDQNGWIVGDDIAWEFEPGNTTITFTKVA